MVYSYSIYIFLPILFVQIHANISNVLFVVHPQKHPHTFSVLLCTKKSNGLLVLHLYIPSDSFCPDTCQYIQRPVCSPSAKTPSYFFRSFMYQKIQWSTRTPFIYSFRFFLSRYMPIYPTSCL